MRREPAPINVTDLIGFKLFRLSNTLGLAAEREYFREFGLSIPEWRCLSIIASRGSVAPSEIVAAIKTDKAWVSRTLARLEMGALVAIAPDPADGRRQIARPTVKGRALNDRLLVAAIRRHEWVLETLERDERQGFLRAMESLQRRADYLLAIETH